jgi:hypothetical protein
MSLKVKRKRRKKRKRKKKKKKKKGKKKRERKGWILCIILYSTDSLSKQSLTSRPHLRQFFFDLTRFQDPLKSEE